MLKGRAAITRHLGGLEEPAMTFDKVPHLGVGEQQGRAAPWGRGSTRPWPPRCLSPGSLHLASSQGQGSAEVRWGRQSEERRGQTQPQDGCRALGTGTG